MATTAKTPRVGRPFIALHTKMLGDSDFLDLTVAARWTFIALMLHTAEQGLAGYVPGRPRHIERIAELGSTDAAEAARDELISADFLVATGDPDRLLIRTWARYQADIEPEANPRRSAGQLRRAHNEGRHADHPAEGCELCQGSGDAAHTATGNAPVSPASLQVVPVAPVLAVVPDPVGDGDEGTGSARPVLTGMRAVVADIAADLDEALDAVDAQQHPVFKTPLQVYTQTLAEVPALVEALDPAVRSKDALGFVKNAVLEHAVRRLLGTNYAVGQQAINGINGAAKALGPTGHARYVSGVVAKAGEAFEDDQHVIRAVRTAVLGTAAPKSTRTRKAS